MLHAFLILIIDGLAGRFGETFSVKILARHLGYVAGIARDMLRLDVAIGSTDPILALHGSVSILQFFGFRVLGWWLDQVIVLFVIWLRNSHVNIVLGSLVARLGNQPIDFACGASEDLVFLGHMPGITWQVVLSVVDECFRSHFKTDKLNYNNSNL